MQHVLFFAGSGLVAFAVFFTIQQIYVGVRSMKATATRGKLKTSIDEKRAKESLHTIASYFSAHGVTDKDEIAKSWGKMTEFVQKNELKWPSKTTKKSS